MDKIDRAILHELQLDGRLGNNTLAQRVSLSESACLRRVRRLEDNGFIRGYVGLVDQSSAGYPDNVFVRITLHSQQQDDLAAFEKEVKLLPEVMECYLMSGDADYLLRVSRRPRLRAYSQPTPNTLTRCSPGSFKFCIAHGGQENRNTRTLKKRTQPNTRSSLDKICRL